MFNGGLEILARVVASHRLLMRPGSSWPEQGPVSKELTVLLTELRQEVAVLHLARGAPVSGSGLRVGVAGGGLRGAKWPPYFGVF